MARPAILGEQVGASRKIHLPRFRESADVECFSEAHGTFPRLRGEDVFSHKRQIEGFAATILDGVPTIGATVEDGTAAMRAMVAIARSVESGEVVRLDKVTGAV